MHYRKDLQSVRFISMLFVFYFHKKNKYFKGGFIGVDIFFTLSGYFITGSLINRINKSNYFLSFYKGRILRLQPMSNFILVIIYYISIKNSFISFKRSKEILSCLYSYANYYYYYISVNYLEQSNSLNSSPLLHFWSLSVENQFYILHPFIIKFIYIKYNKNSILILFFITFLMSIYICYKNISYAYYSFEVRFCELLFGSYINLIHFGNKIKYQYLYDIIIFIMWIVSNRNCSIGNYPNIKIIYPLITSFLMLIKESSEYSFFSIKLMQYLGSLSYSFYVIHYPLLICNSNISILTVIFLSILCYYFIENIFVKLNVNSFTVYSFSIIIIIIITKLQINSYNKYIRQNINARTCKCMFIQDSIITNECLFYEESFNYNIIKYKNKYILLLGDSHLRQWNNILMPIYQSTGLKIVFFIFWINYFLNNNYLVIKKVINIIGNPVYVFECFCSTPFYRNNTYLLNYKYLNTYLSNISNKIIIIVDNPLMSFNPNIYYSQNLAFNKLYCVININCTVDIQPRLELKNIIYINLTTQFCRKDMCFLYRRGVKIYSGHGHLTDCVVLLMKDYMYGQLNFIKKKYLHLHNIISKKISYCYIQNEIMYNKLIKTIKKSNQPQ